MSHVRSIFFFCGSTAITLDVLRSHSDTPHSVGNLRPSDQPITKNSNWQHTTLTRDRHPCPCGIRTYNPNKRAATNPRLRLRGHWDRLLIKYTYMGSYRLDTRICSRECVWGWVWRVNIITVLRVNMLHCTFIKGKIIVVDNWRGRDRMEGFYYWSVQMMSSEHLSTIVFRIKGFSTYCSKALLVEWTSCFVWTAFCCHIICILSSVQNSRQCKSFFLSVVLLVA